MEKLIQIGKNVRQRIGGRDAIRNIVEHRTLVPVTLEQEFASQNPILFPDAPIVAFCPLIEGNQFSINIF